MRVGNSVQAHSCCMCSTLSLHLAAIGCIDPSNVAFGCWRAVLHRYAGKTARQSAETRCWAAIAVMFVGSPIVVAVAGRRRSGS